MTFEGRARILVLAAFSLLYFLLMACTFNSLGVVLPYMVQDLGWNWAAAGLGFTLLGIACGITSVLPAMMTRRIGVSFTLLCGGTILMAGFLCFAMTEGTLLYYIGALLVGLGFSLAGTVPAIHVISQIFVKRSTAIGFYFTAGGLGSVFGPLLVYATQYFTSNWRIYWVGAAITAMLLGLFAASVTATRNQTKLEVDVDDESGPVTGWSAKAAFRKPQYYVIVAVYSAFLLINTTVHGFAAQHISETGFSMGVAATLLSASALVSAGASTIAGLAGEKFGPRELTMLSMGTMVGGTIALAVGGSWIAMIIFVVGLGIGMGFSYVSTAMLLLDFFGKRANLELYSVMCVISTSAAVGPAIGGLIRDAVGSFQIVFLACAALGFLLLLVLMRLKKPELGQAPQAQGSDAAQLAEARIS